MESPVRICLGATVVVNLLFLCSTIPGGNTLPSENTTATIVSDKLLSSRYSKANGTTWVPRGRTRNANVNLNELNPKESLSEEQTDAKNAKYKDRGRVKFFTSVQSSTSTFKPRRFVKTSTEGPKFTIVTPTLPKKNITEILDSMREYKRTKLPISSTTPSTAENLSVVNNDSNDDDDNDDYDDENDYSDHEDHKSTNFHSNNFFTIPGFDDEFSQDSKQENYLPKKSYSVPPYDKYSSYFPKDSYSSASNSDNFYDFDLTTPRHDAFDKKFKEISNSIMKNLAAVKTRNPTVNSTNHKLLKENVGVENFSRGIPTNKSTVYIKNTKEIRMLDNEEAGTANKELSDVHGTSIYYEMSVLSTETYSIDNSNEDDCDNDTTQFEPTPSTSTAEENASIKATHDNLAINKSVNDSNTDSTNNNIITPSAQILVSSNSPSTTTESAAMVTTVETSTHKYSSNFRNRDYSKRINFSNNREYSNSVTVKPDHVTPVSVYKPVTRRIHYPTPKTKPIWMAPRKNNTKSAYTKTTYPTTIYAEHFNIKDAVTPKNNKTSSVLTTVSSNIDPILQSDMGGLKKVVHSQSISDNSIPHLRKRGSMKYTTTASSTELETEISQDIMDIPSTAWALAALKPSPSINPAKNISKSTPKSVDDDELQNVDEQSDNKEISSTTSTTKDDLNTDYSPMKNIDDNQNKLVWKPTYTEPTAETEIKTTTLQGAKTERVPAESNISIQSSVQPITTENIENFTENKEVSSMITVEETTKSINLRLDENKSVTKPTNATAFESITKLPSGITTPQVEESITPLTETSIRVSSTDPPKVIQTQSPHEDDFEVTTIRFTYIPTILDDIIETTEKPVTTDVWHPVTVDTTIKPVTENTIVTTYRPKYMTTTDKLEDIPTVVPETTTMSEKYTSTNNTIVENLPTTTVKESVTLPSIESTPHLETSTVIVEVYTEINTVRETRKPPTTMLPLTTEAKLETTSNKIIDIVSEENSGSNEVITHVKETTTQKNEENDDDMTVIPMSKPESDEVESTEKTEEEQEENDIFNKSEIPDKQFEVPKETTTIFEDTQSSRDATKQSVVESTTDFPNQLLNELEGLSGYGGDMTTEASSRVLDEAGSGAAVAIAVSTIGVIALILLVGLLLVVRKRGRRGVYAQRCTPVSLDAYSLDSVSVGHRKGNHRLRASKRSYGNPAYDDEVTSHPMTYAALANFALDVDSMSAEFAEIPTVTVRPEEVPPGCEDKNRYSNVLPLPETRVPLKRIGNDPTTEYINASYVTGPGNIRNYYIACQAPLANTVADFWRMIWEQNSRLIVMLTEYMENGVEKCYEYLPPSEVSDNKRTFGDFQIILQKREQRDKYAVSTVQLFNLETRRWREVTHLWYFWPAKGVPDDYDSIIDFLSEMRSYMKMSQNGKEYDEQGLEIETIPESRSSFKIPRVREDLSPNANVYSPQREEMLRRSGATNGTLARMKAASETEGGVRPCVAVCTSGAGRASLVLALDECARALAAGQADVPRAVRRLRAERPHALANKHHYILLYKVLSEYGNKLMGGGVDGI